MYISIEYIIKLFYWISDFIKSCKVKKELWNILADDNNNNNN